MTNADILRKLYKLNNTRRIPTNFLADFKKGAVLNTSGYFCVYDGYNDFFVNDTTVQLPNAKQNLLRSVK